MIHGRPEGDGKNLDENNDSENDFVGAYFKQRCSKNTNSLFKGLESDDESSLGVLDVDNLSGLDDMERLSLAEQTLQDGLTAVTVNDSFVKPKPSNISGKDMHNRYSSIYDPIESEFNIIKQRDLAKKTLMDLNHKFGNCAGNETSVEVDSESSLKVSGAPGKNRICDMNLKAKSNNWFENIQSPQTPRFFKDELNSVNGSSCEISGSGVTECLKKIVNMKENDKNDSVPKKVSVSGTVRDSEFFSEIPNAVDVIHRLEEDEKKFKQEQSGILNNSEISQFSGIVEGSKTTYLSELFSEEIPEKENLSIGKYFELRSHSINSLVGSKNPYRPSSGSLESNPSILKVLKMQNSNVENENFDNLANLVEQVSWMQNPKVSTSGVKRLSEASSCKRYSNDSRASASILLIQNLLRSMDPVLSGTQINDKLIECLDKMKMEKRKESDICARTSLDTPIPTKTDGKRENRRVHNRAKTTEPVRSNSSANGESNVAEEMSEFNMSSSAELKENFPRTPPLPKTAKNVLSLRNDYVSKGRKKNFFDSSTPKMEGRLGRSETEKCKSAGSKLLMSDKEWETPRISSILKPISFSDSAAAGDDKTLLNSSSASSESAVKNATLIAKDSVNLEETFADGDLTLLSQPIAEINKKSHSKNNLCAFDEDDVLADIEELLTYPKGSIDCSALTQVVQERFPDLLVKISPQLDDSRCAGISETAQDKMDHPIEMAPGSWVKISAKCDYKDSCYMSLGDEKLVPITVENLTGSSLIVSLEDLNLDSSKEKGVLLSRIGDEFVLRDYGSFRMKSTLVTPKGTSSCKLYIAPKLTEIVRIRFKVKVKKLRESDIQFHYSSVRLVVILPQENITLLPAGVITFGTIPYECTEKKAVRLTYDGLCDLPLKIFVDESQCFTLNSVRNMDDEKNKNYIWRDNKYSCVLKQGEKKTLELKIKFFSCLISEDASCSVTDATGILNVALDIPSENNVLFRVPITGSVALPRFLCNNSCVPLIFQASEPGQPIKRLFPLKNIGPVDLEFSLHIAEESKVQPNEESFFVPKRFILRRDEEKSIEVIFSAKKYEKHIKRRLILHMQPNGLSYDVELIGIVTDALHNISTSRCSSRSGSTSTGDNPETLPFQLKSTTSSLSWPAVSMDSDVKQTFHVMNTSGCNAVARFSFRWDTSSFRFLNEKGEMVEKLKKLLKPNCSDALTLVFRPDSVGPHINSIMIETNCLYGKKMISLNGFGGSPKISMKRVKFDLNGSRIVRLVNSEPESQIFQTTVEFANRGNVPGFISISKVTKVLSLSNELHIEPSNFVLLPSAKREVKIFQKLKNEDVKRTLSGRDIGKIATITVTTGDEPSRFRMRKLIDERKINCSESVESLVKEFSDEKYEDVSGFDDGKWFHNVFLKYLDTTEITAVIERPADTSECTIFDDLEETVKEFVTVLPAPENNSCSDSTRSTDKLENSDTASKGDSNSEKTDWSFMNGESSKWRDQKIAKWLKDNSHNQEL